MDDRHDPAARFHERFSRVSRVFPGMVGLAYTDHLTDALDGSDETVLATVRDWEEQHGMAHRDWQAIGRDERGEQGWYSDDKEIPALTMEDLKEVSLFGDNCGLRGPPEPE